MELAPEEVIIETGKTIDGQEFIATKEDKSTKKMSMWVVIGIIAIIFLGNLGLYIYLNKQQ